MDRFIVKVLTRIMDATEVSLLDDIWACDLDSVSLLPDNEVNIGTLAEQGLESLFESGDIGSSQKTKFLSAVKCFWTAVYTYAVDKLPFNDEVIINSKWVNFTQRHEAKFSQVKFFLNRFPVLALTSPQIDTLREEFDDYKSMKETEIKLDSCTIDIQYKDISNVLVKKKDYLLDKIWGMLGQLPSPVLASSSRFFYLTKVASVVLVIPHSNADEERIFSSVRKDKTTFRASMDIDRTLSSLLICQLNHDGDCLSYEPSRDVVLKSKKVTKEYNKEHSTNKR